MDIPVRLVRMAVCWSRAIRAAVLVCVLAGVCVAQVDNHDALPAPKRFVFDGGFYGSGGLKFSFSRDMNTVDFDGQPVAANVPRYSRQGYIATAPTLEVIREHQANTLLLGSGLGTDGVTPILVLYQTGSGFLDVFTVADDDIITAELTGVGRNRTVVGTDPVADIMQGAYPGKAYTPRAGTVCHGLIVLVCEVMVDIGQPEWESQAVAIVYSRDAGLSWHLQWEDTPIQTGLARGREWCMQNWWPIDRDGPILEAYFAFTDYRTKWGVPKGGRAYMFRAKRPAVGASWQIEPVQMIYETTGSEDEHAHTAALAPFGAEGLRFLMSLGDGQTNNRIVSLTRTDRDYFAPGWTVNPAYHGSRGKPGTEGNQFVGCAPGPSPNEVIVGSDLHNEQVMKLVLNDQALSHPRTEFLYGYGHSDGGRAENFNIRTPTPELGGPYVCTSNPHTIGQWRETVRRLLYSPDGRRWVQVIAPASGASWTAVVHGGHLYYDHSGHNAQALQRVPIPKIFEARPLIIGPGGLQRLVRVPPIWVGHSVVYSLWRNAEGLWVDGTTVLDPQPPCFGRVYRIEARTTDWGPWIADFGLLDDATNFGQILGTDQAQVRVWIRNLMSEKVASPQVVIKGNQSPPQLTQKIFFSSTDRWHPVTFAGPLVFGDTETFRLRLYSGSINPDDQSFYIAMDGLAEGAGFPGYAMPLNDGPPETGVWRPDELASLHGFTCGPNWTITLAGQIPEDGWDGVTDADTTEWPLATLWADENNYIELIALVADDERLIMRIVRDGVAVVDHLSHPLTWTRGSSIFVSVAESGQGITMVLSAGGSEIYQAINFGGDPHSLVAPITNIMFSSPEGVSGDGLNVAVTPMLWWGGRIDEHVGLTTEERTELLGSLSFLGSPETAIVDFDGDGQVTGHDIAALVRGVVVGDPAADITGDGIVDSADLVAYFNLNASRP